MTARRQHRPNRDDSQVTSQSRTDPKSALELEMKFSEDSSVFSGLVDQENEMNTTNRLREPAEIRQPPKGILRTSRHTGPAKYVVIENSSREESDLYSRSGSSLTSSRNSRSVMREMPAMVDAESDSMLSVESSIKRDIHYDHDGDANPQATWGEANDTMRATGSVRLLSSVRFMGDNNSDEGKNTIIPSISKSDSAESTESRIVELLDDFERQMDANIQSLSEENDEEESNVLTDFNKNIVSKNSDIYSQGPQLGEFLDPHKAKKLQRILEKARKDVEVLRDNNEQYRSEIEQMEEEHKSEIKLVEDRAKRKLVELKNMYQNEIDRLGQEGDAAVVEAGRIAARYAENGRKQVSKLQKQIDKLKAAAAITIREKIKAERELTSTSKDKESSEKVHLLQISHQGELEKLRKEYDERLKLEVEKAASSVAKRVRLNQDVLISELTTQIDDLKKERHSIVEVLQSVKAKLAKNYPEQMKDFSENSAKPSEDDQGDESSTFEVEKTIMENIEIYTYLLEGAEAKIALAKRQSVAEEKNEEDRKMAELQHRAEIESLRREMKEKDDKMRKLEEDFKALSLEKCLLGEKFQRESETHKQELERMSAQKDTFLSIERSRKDLKHAMAEGQKELAHAKESGENLHLTLGSQLYLPSVSSPVGTSSTGKHIVVRSTDQRRSFDMPPSPSAAEPSSVEKARNFQRRHPKRFLRVASRDSPRYRLSGNFSSKQVKESADGNIQIPINVIHNPQNPENKSVISNGSVQSNGTLSSLKNHVREAEDQVLDIINSMSDSTSKSVSSDDKSMRSKDTILSNFRKQSQRPKIKDKLEFDEQDHLKEYNECAKISDEGIKAERNMEQSMADSKLASRRRSSIHLKDNANANKKGVIFPQESGKEYSLKKDNLTVLRRARMFRQFVDENRHDDNSLQSGRLSLDESISSLQTNNGARPYKSSTMKCSDGDRIVHNISHEASTSVERGTNTLGMFVHGKSERQFENDMNPDCTMSDLATEVATQTEPPRSLHSETERVETVQNFQSDKNETLRERSSLLNFKKPPVSFDGSKSNDLSGKKVVANDVFNGRKGDPPSSVPSSRKTSSRIDPLNSATVVSIPSSIAVRPPMNKTITGVANGHTLLCKPLSVHQSKIYPEETVSNLSGGTMSSSEDDELVYESHAQMRKLPPLTDDLDDEGSGVDEQDRYHTIGSRSREDNFKREDNFERKEEKNGASVDAKKSKYRRMGLAAFKPSKSSEGASTRHTSETNSTAGSSSSDATTTITAHTRKSISFRLSPRRSKTNTSKYSYASDKASTNGSKRFAALKARVRVRKV